MKKKELAEQLAAQNPGIPKDVVIYLFLRGYEAALNKLLEDAEDTTFEEIN